MEEFDYIIVGGGSAGSALAARLSEDSRRSVLLLEAGGKGRHPWLRLPIGYGKVFHDARFNWKYETGPEPGLDGRTMYWPRGRTLGGSSAINAMVWVRGHPADYEEWGAQAPGWGWQDVAPVFQRMEAWEMGGDAWRGGEGPVSVSDMSGAVHPLTRRYLRAAEQSGLAFNPDYNGANMEGAFTYQITTKSGLRASAADAYLRPALNRPNLRVETGAFVTRVRFDASRATGVDYIQNGQSRTARACGETILCGGAINTPALLQHSGIGPGGLLQRLSLPVLRDAPGVGQNLMDHLGLDIVYAANRASLNQVLRPLHGKVRIALQYAFARTGPLAMSLNQGGGFIRLSDRNGPPDLQLYFSPLSYERAPPGKRPLLTPDPFAGFRFGFSPCKPLSRGSLAIASPDPMVPPAMTGGYFHDPDDLEMFRQGIALIRRIAAAPALAEIIAHELKPGADVAEGAELDAHIRADSWTVFHQCGTCRMGRDADSVVDEHLRVRGINGLRVADASIFPTIPSGNTNAPAIMVGEKAADILRGADSP